MANARAALPWAEADSCIGATSSGDYLPERGGISAPAMVSADIGILEDVREQQLGP